MSPGANQFGADFSFDRFRIGEPAVGIGQCANRGRGQSDPALNRSACTCGGRPLTEQSGIARAGFCEQLDEAPCRVRPLADRTHHIDNMAQHRIDPWRRGRGFTDFAQVDFVEGENAARAKASERGAYETDGIGLVNDHIAADHDVIAPTVVRVGLGPLLEDNVPDTSPLGPLRGESNSLGRTVDTNRRAFGTDQLRGKHRHIACAATEIENPHARLYSGAFQQPLGDRA